MPSPPPIFCFKTIEVWASNAHLYLILLLYFKSVCGKGTKQSTVLPCFHIPDRSPLHSTWPSSPLRADPFEHRHASERMQRYTLYIEVAFQCNPHRVDDRVLLKRKRHAWGDFKSEEDIRKIHWKKSPLAIVSGPILYLFFRGKSVFSGSERGAQRKEGAMPFFLCRSEVQRS